MITDRETKLVDVMKLMKKHGYTRKEVEKAVTKAYGINYGLDAEYTKGVPEYEGQCEN